MFDHPLHRGRVEKGLSLSQIAESTRLSPLIVSKIDQGRFEELPAGVYARSYVRAFAAAVGVDPGRALDEVAGLLPPAPDPFPVIREIKEVKAGPSKDGALSRRLVSAIDAAALLAINAAVVRLIALVAGVPVDVLLQHGSAAVAIVCAVPIALYFVLFGGIGGRTPGAMVCRLPGPPPRTPLVLRTILLRALG